MKRFYYQPSPIFSTIDWCWTFIVLLTGIIFWLEVTHFQWITLVFFIGFFVIMGLELINRKLVINHEILAVKNMFGRTWHRFNVGDMAKETAFTRHSVIIRKRGRQYRFCLTRKDIDQLKTFIKAAK